MSGFSYKDIYIEEAIHIPAMESTTSELIEAIRTASTKKKMALTFM